MFPNVPSYPSGRLDRPEWPGRCAPPKVVPCSIRSIPLCRQPVNLSRSGYRTETPARSAGSGIPFGLDVALELQQRFLDEFSTGVPIQPVTAPIALRAGQIDGQSQAKGVRIPLSDLLVGASALEVGYGVGTANVRHFQLIPGLNVSSLARTYNGD